MTITILTDNRSACPERFTTEHGLSVHVQSKGRSFLLDTGASGLFAANAEQLGIDLKAVDYVFISHGHGDHAGGLAEFLSLNKKAKIIVSDKALGGQFFSKRRYFHSITPEWPLQAMRGRTIFVDDTQDIDDGLFVITHILPRHELPKGNSNLFIQTPDEALIPDDFRHEMALYVDGFLFTGCAHNGLENILDACSLPVHTVLGGFHLLDSRGDETYESTEELTALAQRLVEKYPDTTFYTSHCTGDLAFATMHEVMGDQLQPFSCGMQFTINESPSSAN